MSRIENPTHDTIRIIAEAGVNHNGSLDMACELVDAAALAGADAVKFQTFNTSDLMTRSAPKADYQKAVTDAGSQFDMIREFELTLFDHQVLMARAQERGIQFMSTPFDQTSIDMLVDTLGLKELKLPSGEITNGPLLLHAARKRIPIILSTGMCSLDDIGDALNVVVFGMLEQGNPSKHILSEIMSSKRGQAVLNKYVTLLHCTTQYPAPMNSINLRAMDEMSNHFNVPVGYSDHTEGITVAVAAAARGARVIEKHITLDRDLPGPDHQASADPFTFGQMVAAVREVEQALGSKRKQLAEAETANVGIARRSLVAKSPIQAGEVFSVDNLTAKRPGTGLSPMYYWECLGRTASRDYAVDELIAPEEGG